MRSDTEIPKSNTNDTKNFADIQSEATIYENLFLVDSSTVISFDKSK